MCRYPYVHAYISTSPHIFIYLKRNSFVHTYSSTMYAAVVCIPMIAHLVIVKEKSISWG